MPAVGMIEPVQTPSVKDAAAVLATLPETIEAAYAAWDDVRQSLSTLRNTFAAERARLAQQGELLLGAVGAVRPVSSEGLVRRADVDRLAEEARKNLADAQASLEARAAEAERALQNALRAVVDEVRARVIRRAERVPPKVELMVRVLPGDRRILHARRPSADTAVCWVYAVSQRIPSRHHFLFDDSTDDVLLAPPTLYADEGIEPSQLRPSPKGLAALLEPRPTVWPIKGIIPMVTSFGAFRWLGRGAVLEAEVADGEHFRNLLTKEEAEALTGALLSLKLEGKIDFELVRG
jgi:hypothetical protein